MIVLCTDFGVQGPYVGQMKAVLYRDAPAVPVVELFADLPRFDPQSAAYLIAAYCGEFPAGTVVLGVVDPGVGGPRLPLVLNADGRWYVGPDNGLFTIVARRARSIEQWQIEWRPERLSVSFHGRDLFAPVAARLALSNRVEGRKMDDPQKAFRNWPDDLSQVVYIDHFGNAVTGMRAGSVNAAAILEVNGQRLECATTFSDVPEGVPFWYENANGLVEIAVNQGSAVQLLGLEIATPIIISPSTSWRGPGGGSVRA